MTTETGTTGTQSSALDLTTLMKASTAISGEIVLASLLTKLMSIVIENAGAQRGLLILQEGDELLIQAEQRVGSEAVVLQAETFEGSGRLAESVLAYVARTGESLVLHDVQEDERFAQDAYVVEAGSRSVLCMPILNRGELTGVLYLEHRGAIVAFTEDRTELLRLLSGQIALSIDNAMSYETLESKVRERTEQVVEEKENVEQALERLHTTQAQLIQSEKMALLGQLTAGIAHEIKNPLNFVNNFADLSTSLAQDLRDDLQDGVALEEIDAMIDDLTGNAGQIAKHGQRAGAIVQAMSEHAKTGQGEREPADLNALLDECVRRTREAFATRMPGFDASIGRRFDDSIDSLRLVPQDMERVFSNLLSNAFESLAEPGRPTEDDAGPTITVETRRLDDRVQVRISDNGRGVAESERERIFEPFYTSKSTGDSHTEMGLSLSYDIVTRGHGGALSVESAAEGGVTFVISLPSAPDG